MTDVFFKKRNRSMLRGTGCKKSKPLQTPYDTTITNAIWKSWHKQMMVFILEIDKRNRMVEWWTCGTYARGSREIGYDSRDEHTSDRTADQSKVRTHMPWAATNGRTINWSSDVNIDPNHNSLQFYIGCLDWPISAALFSLGRCLCYPRFPSVPGWGGLISSPIWEHVNFLSTKNIFTQASPLSK